MELMMEGGKGGKGPGHDHMHEEKEEKMAPHHSHESSSPFEMQSEMAAVLAELMGSTSTGTRAARYKAARSVPNFMKMGRYKHARAVAAGMEERNAAIAGAKTAFPGGLSDQDAGMIATRAEKMLDIGQHWATASE